MKMDFLYTLRAVIDGGSFAAAAKEMHLSASAVSLQMKRLEEYFGQPLFDRSALAVQPTPLALEIRDSLHGALENIQGFRRRASAQLVGEIKVGVVDSMQAAILPASLRYLKNHYPGLSVRTLRGRSTELTDAVKRGAIDAAIVVDPAGGGAKRLHWQPLLRRQMIMIAPPDSRQTSMAALLDRYDLIRFERSTTMHRLAARFLSESGLSARGELELQSIHAVVAMVSAGLGIAILFMPDPRIALGFPVREISLGARAPTMGIALVSRSAEADNRTMQVLQHAFKRAAERLGGANA